MPKKIKVCFISQNAYPLFDSSSKAYFGGAEVQISLIAKNLARDNRFQVHLVVGDYGQPDRIKKDNVFIWRCFKEKAFFFTTTLHFLKTLKEIDADFYIERTANLGVTLIYFFRKIFNKKFVYMVAHDWDCSLDLFKYIGLFNSPFYYLGLKNADVIISQTSYQKEQLSKNFNLSSVVMPSIIKVTKEQERRKKKYLLWVGRAVDWKQPKLFIKMARDFVEENFFMICQKGKNERFFKEIEREALSVPNLKLYSFISFAKISDYFKEAKVLVNTSLFEGFPNTFLQAGVSRTPILSLSVNPDGFISKYNCGFWANSSYQKLKKYLKILIRDNKLAKRMGENNFKYVRKNHSLDNIEVLKKELQKII